MAAFQPFVPNGQINIYRFVPLDESYQNTLHFRDRAAQLAYFQCDNNLEPHAPVADTIVKLHFSGNTFTRNERQYIHIEGNACNYYDCNYMAFQNMRFGQMWFFAFIHSVEFVNPNVTEIVFQLDVMQSFMWNYELRECWVVREHSLTDKVGDSLTTETIPNVPFKNTLIERSGHFLDYSTVMITTVELATLMNEPKWKEKPAFRTIGGLPFGGDMYRAPTTSAGASQVETTLQAIAENGALDGIVTMYLFPTDFISATGEPATYTHTIQKPSIENNSLIDGYKPANNKLFTFPYTFINVDTGNAENTYKFEYFPANQQLVAFEMTGVLGCQPQIIVIPLSYDSADSGVTDISQSLVCEDFPIVQFSGDNFSNWWGQNGWSNKAKMELDVLQMVAGGALAVETKGKYGANLILGGASDMSATIGDIVTNMNVPPTARSAGGTYGLYVTKQRDITFRVIQPTAEGARMIDDLFTKYGYTCNKIKVPNIRFYDQCRPHFNYIKCGDMSFHWELFADEGKGTSVPQKYMNEIIQIYQNGITFWKDPLKVGRYDDFKYDNIVR